MLNATPVTAQTIGEASALVAVSNNTRYQQDLELEWSIQIGGKTFPQSPVNSIAENWSQLRNLDAGYDKSPISITAEQYHTRKFVAAIDLEAMPSGGYSCLSTKHDKIITFKLKAITSDTIMT